MCVYFSSVTMYNVVNKFKQTDIMINDLKYQFLTSENIKYFFRVFYRRILIVDIIFFKHVEVLLFFK